MIQMKCLFFAFSERFDGKVNMFFRYNVDISIPICFPWNWKAKLSTYYGRKISDKP